MTAYMKIMTTTMILMRMKMNHSLKVMMLMKRVMKTKKKTKKMEMKKKNTWKANTNKFISPTKHIKQMLSKPSSIS